MKSWGGDGMGDQQRNLYAGLTIILAVAVVYMPVIGFEFLNYDDPLNVYENPLITDFSTASLHRFWRAPFEGLYIPLTYSVWGFLAIFSEFFWAVPPTALEPAVYHAANLFVHLASVLVFFRLLRLIFSDARAAAAGALLFGLHPVQVEPVAWVTGMKDLLGGFFSILALERYLQYAAAAGEARPGVSRRRYVFATLFFVLALLAKPSAITLPLLAGTIGFFCLDRSPRLLARELLPWLLLTFPVIYITGSAQTGARKVFDFSIWQRLLVAGDAVSFYLGKLFWPVNLAPDYGRNPVRVLAGGWVYATLLPPLALAGLLWWKWRAPQLRAGVLIFFLALLPVLGLFTFDFQKISTVADRYLYLAMLGPGLLTAWLVCRFRDRRAVLIPVFATLVLLGLGSRLALRHWHDSLVFNTHALAVNPVSTVSYNNLGASYLDAGNFREALASYRRAIEIAAGIPDAYVNLGNLYGLAGMPKEAIAYYQQAIPRVPQNYGLVYLKIADAYNKLDDFDQALRNYRQSLFYYRLAEKSGHETAWVYTSIGLLYKGQGLNDEAIEAYQQALLEKPDFAEALSNLGLIYEELGRLAEAEECYRRAVARKPTLAEPYNNLGLLYLGQNREKEAVPLFLRAMRLSPRQPVPANNLGRAYLALGQYDEALVAFQQALKIRSDFAPALAGLAQTYRRMGREDLAGAYDAKARALGYVEPRSGVGGSPTAQPERP